MDFAYDHIAERTYSTDRSSTSTPKPDAAATTTDSEPTTTTTPTQPQSSEPSRQTLQTELSETLRTFSASPWGAKLGGWWSSAAKQGASYYETARREAEKREIEAAKVLEDARRVVAERAREVVEGVEEGLDGLVNEERRAQVQAQEALAQKERQEREAETEVAVGGAATGQEGQKEDQEDTETFLNRFKSEAAKRLKEVQKAEDAADEALLRFGSNVRNFLRDTISISAPDAESGVKASEVLFESKDAVTGKRVIHASRFDAQVHVIHSTAESFTRDPDGSEGEWEKFKEEFDIEKETDRIAGDLERYPELRSAMEKLVPETVEYKDFWTRYYFLRHVVQVREERRREMLRASADQTDEEVAWDEDSEPEDTPPTTHDQVTVDAPKADATSAQTQSQSQANTGTTMATSHTRSDSDAMTLRPSRRSHDEKSVADSEASYDLINASGAASHADGSPKAKATKEEESDDDWE